MLHTSGLFSFFLEPSNYETLGTVWDGFNSKTKYKLPDWFFMFYPEPPLLRTLAMAGRSGFIRKLSGLCTGSQFVFQTIEKEALSWIKNEFPEGYKEVLISNWDEGVPLPAATLECQIPLDVNKLVRDDGTLNRNYPNSTKMTMETMGFTQEDAFDGYLTDITHETPLDAKVDRENLITRGFGKESRFLK